jgi:hypothetical protein
LSRKGVIDAEAMEIVDRKSVEANRSLELMISDIMVRGVAA